MQINRAVTIVLAVLHSTALAQPTGAQAETLFKRGRELMAGGEYAQACASLEASQKLEPSTATLVNLADCREKNQQYATAWGLYLQAERELRGVTDVNGSKVRELVKTRAATLEPRLSKLTIKVPGASHISQLEILRDNDRVELGAWNQALPVDGGTFKISARAPDRREWSTTVTLAPEGDAQDVAIPALVASTPPPVPPVPAVAMTANLPEEADAPAPATKRSLRLPITFAAVTVALGGTALGFELWSRGIYSDAQAATGPARQKQLLDAANVRRYVAVGLGLATIGCAGTAVYLYLRGRGDESSTKPRLSISPTASAGFSGLSLDGRW